jgi:hypothetical protein
MNPCQYEIPFCVDYNKTTFLKIYGLSTVMERAAEGTKTQDKHNSCFRLTLIFTQTTNFKEGLYKYSSHKVLLGYARIFQEDYCRHETNHLN